jgi:hypothetical protein
LTAIRSDEADAPKRRKRPDPLKIEPMVARRAEAAAMLGVSEFVFTAGVKSGLYPAPCIDILRTQRWSLKHLRDFLHPPGHAVAPVPVAAKVKWPRMPRRVPLGPGVQHLYRHFDADGRLLYVGVSLSAIGRLAEHKQGAEWFWLIARVEVTAYANRRTVLKAERIAIQREKPLHNIRHAKRTA